MAGDRPGRPRLRSIGTPDATRQHQEAREAGEAGEEGQAQRAGGVTAPRGVLVWISLCLHGGMPSLSHSISVAINYNKI